MFFIINKTKHTIAISDLKLSLGPRQGVDLDRIVSRETSNKSKLLKKLSKKGIIFIQRKDEENKNIKIESHIDNSEKFDIKELKKEFREGIKGLSNELKKQSNNNNSISKNDLQELITQMMSMMQQNQTGVRYIEREKENEEEDVKMDENILTDIHARAVKDLTKDSKMGSINYKKEEIDDNLEDNIDELENLLG